jgi:hypothetical protein
MDAWARGSTTGRFLRGPEGRSRKGAASIRLPASGRNLSGMARGVLRLFWLLGMVRGDVSTGGPAPAGSAVLTRARGDWAVLRDCHWRHWRHWRGTCRDPGNPAAAGAVYRGWSTITAPAGRLEARPPVLKFLPLGNSRIDAAPIRPGAAHVGFLSLRGYRMFFRCSAVPPR